MKRGAAKLQRIFKGLFKVLVFTILFLISLVFLLGIISRSSLVQTYVVKKITERISEEKNVHIDVEKVYLSGFKTVNVDGALIRDHHLDTMIYVKALHGELSLRNIFEHKTLHLSDIILESPYVYFHKGEGDTALNLNYFIRNISSSSPDTTTESLKIALHGIDMKDGLFILHTDSLPDTVNTFNPGYIKFEDINAGISQLLINSDTVNSMIDTLRFTEYKSEKQFQLLHTDFGLNSGTMYFKNTDLSFGRTVIRDSLEFLFKDWSEWQNFNENVRMNFNLTESRINTEDLNFFLPLWKWPEEDIGISGDLSGNLSDFSLKKFDLLFGKRSFLKGDISIEGLPEVDNTIISLRLKKSNISSSDMRPFLPDKVETFTNNLNYLAINGSFYGFYYDFVSESTFNTALGTVNTDINFKVPESGPAKYSGRVNTRNFELGKLLNKENLVRTINLNAELDGSGLSAKEADIKMEAALKNSIIYDYKYNEITFDARLKENLFDGILSVNDTALKVEINGLVNLDPDIEKIDVSGEIFRAELEKINLTQKKGFAKGKLDLDFKGLEFDKTSGRGYLSDIEILYDEKYLELDTMSVVSQLLDSIRNIDVNSELFDANIVGNFKIKNVVSDFNMIIEEYRLQLINESSKIENYYSKKETRPKSYSAKWSIDFYDINPLTSLVVPELFVSQNTSVKGRFSVGNTEIFNVYTQIDTVIYDQYQFYNNEIDVSTSKFSDSSEILAFVFINSEKQVIPDLIEGKEFKTEILWNDNKIHFESMFRQFDDSNYVDLKGLALFKDDSTILEFENSNFKIYENFWSIRENNRVVFKKAGIIFKDFVIASKYESISISGLISKNPETALYVDIKDFNMRSLNPLIGRELSGVLNADLEINDIFDKIRIYGDITANDCTIDGFLVGDINGNSVWDNRQKAIVSEIGINRLGKPILDLNGKIKPAGDATELDFNAKLNSTNMKIIEPFASEIISDVAGQMDGFLKLTGTTSRPLLRGEVSVKKGGFKLNYLNTYYTFNDRLYFNIDNISAKNLVLKDENGNTATLDGGIYHDGFSNPVIDIRGRLNKFKMLNTSADKNNLYYGTAIASGTFSLLGSFTDIQIDADLSSEKGTNIHIPTDNYTELEKGSHITFLSEIVENENKELEDQFEVDLSGIKMDLKLDINPETQMEIILDRQTGDIIKGKGRGNLSMEIDTRGEFKMYGFYEIAEGSYNFTLLNVVNKEFNIEENSRISWSGDPYRGEMDITATYTQNVQLKPIMYSADSIFRNSPQASRRSPVDVNLFLTGPLLNPDFQFGIEIVDPPVYQGYDFNNDLLAFQNRIENNKDYLNRQVFSLIVLKQFSQENMSYQQSTGSNLSELLSNQLSNYVSSVNENLEINLDLSGLSQEDLNDLQLRLSYTFLDGRLRVTREGGFTNSTNEADATSIIGDWTVEYSLTEDGRLKAKVFARNNSNVYQPGTRSTNTTGLSVLYTRSFDEFIEFIKNEEKRSRREERKKRKKSPARIEEMDEREMDQEQ